MAQAREAGCTPPEQPGASTALPAEGWGGLPAPPTAAAAEAAVGRRIVLQGLSRADLNGATGTVLSWHEPSGRWAVELDAVAAAEGEAASGEAGAGAEGAGERVRVKGIHMAPVDAATEPALGGYVEEYCWVQMQE